MSLNPRTLVLAVALAIATAVSPPALSSGGGGGGGGGGNSGTSSAPAKVIDPDYTKAVKAIEVKDWADAIDLLTQVVARDEKNADAYNYLGFAERNRGNLDLAFKHYDRALELDPEHRGAREYLGEAYLRAGDLPKAEEQLKALDKLCFFSCEEYRELKEKIAEYQQSHPSADKHE